MAIVVIRQDNRITEWVKALQAYAPELKIIGSNEEHNPADIDMAVVWKHPAGSLVKYSNLKGIQCSGAGVDFILDDPTTPKNIPLARVVDDFLAQDMAEHVLATILCYLKNFNQYKLNQVEAFWQPEPYKRIQDVSVGILGFGTLGIATANTLINNKFKVLGWSNTLKDMKGVTSYAGKDQLGEFLSKSNVLICLLPLTPTTEGILNAALFQQLPKGAFVVNVARGGHVNDQDLITYLDNQHLSGASLDVYHQEPLSTAHPFWKHPKIQMTPHYASVSETASVVPQIIENYKRLMRNKPLLNEVNRVKGY